MRFASFTYPKIQMICKNLFLCYALFVKSIAYFLILPFLISCAHASQIDVLHRLDKASDAQVKNWLQSISESCGGCKPIVSHEEDENHSIQAMVTFHNKELRTQFLKRGIDPSIHQCGNEIRTIFTFQGVPYCLATRPTQERIFEPNKYDPIWHHISPSTIGDPQGGLTQGNHFYVLTLTDSIVIGTCFGSDRYLKRYESTFILEDEISKIPYLIPPKFIKR